MTVEEAEKRGFCLVIVNKKEFRINGIMLMMHQTYREFDDEGNISRYGVLCRDVRDSEIDIESKFIEAAALEYQPTRYRPFQSEMSIKEIYALGGKAVCYEGKCVRIRRICKEYDGNNDWRYTLVLQETTAPYAVIDAECFEISKWEGEEPQARVKEAAPIVQRYKERLERDRAEAEKIKAIQEDTLAKLKELAV